MMEQNPANSTRHPGDTRLDRWLVSDLAMRTGAAQDYPMTVGNQASKLRLGRNAVPIATHLVVIDDLDGIQGRVGALHQDPNMMLVGTVVHHRLDDGVIYPSTLLSCMKRNRQNGLRLRLPLRSPPSCAGCAGLEELSSETGSAFVRIPTHPTPSRPIRP